MNTPRRIYDTGKISGKWEEDPTQKKQKLQMNDQFSSPKVIPGFINTL